MVLTFKRENDEIDLRVDKKQKISDVIAVIVERRLFNLTDDYMVKSIRDNRGLDKSKSFEENSIYNGDILFID